MGTGFSKQKKQNKMMQERLAQLHAQMEQTEVVGTAGNGLVTITLNGDGSMRSIKIKSECVDPEDVEGLEVLIKAAHNDAEKKLKDQMNLPNMPL